MLDFKCQESAEDTAYHEAGHVVAGIGLGCRPIEVYIREDSTGGVTWLDRAEGQSIAQARRELIHIVAGPVAEFLFEADELWYTRSRWADRLDPGDWEASYRLLSARIRRGETGDEAARCDTTEARFYATEVCRRLKLQDAGEWDERRVRRDIMLQQCRPDYYWMTGLFTPVGRPSASEDELNELMGEESESEDELDKMLGDEEGMSFTHNGPITPPEVITADVLAEVVRAERWAERLLRRRWKAVTAVAEALYQSKDGSLSDEEVLALIAASDRPSRSRTKSSGS